MIDQICLLKISNICQVLLLAATTQSCLKAAMFACFSSPAGYISNSSSILYTIVQPSWSLFFEYSSSVTISLQMPQAQDWTAQVRHDPALQTVTKALINLMQRCCVSVNKSFLRQLYHVLSYTYCIIECPSVCHISYSQAQAPTLCTYAAAHPNPCYVNFSLLDFIFLDRSCVKIFLDADGLLKWASRLSRFLSPEDLPGIFPGSSSQVNCLPGESPTCY